ncbi:RND superfamily putative drug exporter [Tamaricihabitans halophyticus]|uniref:RND superfamily putative drug exporter n=1 Tax=Tamaricihabitans halophyticus TaxID=1262583 RepID=A0A4R2QGY7_9PSEU|nr:MMPL family transporter [Tamaricihabitans halophyticus]TCP47969.1 RND superfamily putative drug exporter [Tamaricihabitans halophyticus]
MATLLYRLADAARRKRGLVVTVWVLVLAIAGGAAAAFTGQTSNQFAIPGTESQETLDRLEEQMPEAAGASGRVVFGAPEGEQLSAEARGAISAAVQEVSQADQVVAAVDPFQFGTVSPDQRIAMAQVQFSVPMEGVSDQAKDQITSAVDQVEQVGVEVGYSQVIAGEMPAISALEAIGVAIAAMVLVITFGSLIAAGMPLLSALVGVGIGIGGIYALTGFIDMSSTSPILAMMLGLAVGIDYALFIVHRHRRQVLDGMSVTESIPRAIGTAGSAVFFAGLTVIIALAGLSVVGIPFLSVMGIAAAATVAIAVLVAITFLPAVLGMVGERIVSPKARAKAAEQAGSSAKPSFGFRWARGVAKRPIATFALVLVSLGVLAVPAFSLELGLPDDSTAQEGSAPQRAHEMVEEGFGSGFSGPLLVVAELPNGANPQAGLQQLAGTLQQVPDVTAVQPAGVSPDGTTGLLQLIPSSGPSDMATKDLVHELRGQADEIQASTGAEISVTGQTAMNIDVSEKLSEALPVYLVVIVGLSLILLAVMFRSLLVPLKATAGFLLTVASSIGVVVAIFQWGWLKDLVGITEGAPIISFLPIILVGILFGLAMDYEVFLVSGMRESYVHGADPRKAVVDGFGHSARVVTAAALIMASVFLGFVFSADPIIKSLGFALAFGVAVDAFVVRMTLVPALMTLFGKAAWWYPRWLDRITPNVDVEGAELDKQAEKRERTRQETVSV